MGILTSLLFFQVAITEIHYGDLFMEESKSFQTPLVHVKIGYANEFQSNFIDNDSLIAGFQWRVLPWVSTGLHTQYFYSHLNESGRDFVDSLDELDVEVNMSLPQWALFWHTQLRLLEGRWNLANLMPLSSQIFVGAGGGLLHQSPLGSDQNERQWSYLWSVEKRMVIYEAMGSYFTAFGSRAGPFFSVGGFLQF